MNNNLTLKEYGFAVFAALVFSIGLLKIDIIANSIVTTKELMLYFSLIIAGCFAMVIGIKHASLNVNITLTDILVFSYLVVLPTTQICFIRNVNMSNLILDFSYFSLYFLFRILAPCDHRKGITILYVYSSGTLVINFAICVAQALEIIPNYYSNNILSGMFTNPGPFSIYIAGLSVFVIYYETQRRLNKMEKRSSMYFSTFSIIFLFVILFYSRAALVGFAITSFVFWIYFILEKYPKFNNKIKPILVIVLLLSIPLGWKLFNIRPDSAVGRTLIWNASTKMIYDAPIIGHGIDNFATKYIHYQASYLKTTSHERYNYLAGETTFSFNDLLQISIEKGIIGLALFLTVLYRKCFRFGTFRNGFSKIFVLTPTILVIIISGLSSYPLYSSPIAAIFWMYIALFPENKVRFFKINSKAIYFICTILVFFYCYLMYTKMNAYMFWEKLINNERLKSGFHISDFWLIREPKFFYDAGNYYASRSNYNHAISFFKRASEIKFDKEYFYSIGNCYEKMGQLDSARLAYSLVEEAIPHLIMPRYLKAVSYYKEGQMNEFKLLANKIINMPPKVQNPEVELLKNKIILLSRKIN